MTDFVPMQFIPPGPMGGEVPVSADPLPSPFQAIVPVSRVVRLDEVSAPVIPVPGQVYQHDYFLLHPQDGSLQRVWFAASLAAVQTNFRMRLVSDDGVALTEWVSFSVLPIKSTVLTEQIGAGAGGPVFLRVQAESQAARLFVTVELLVGEASR